MKSLISVFILIFSTYINGQGRFLEKGKSGLGIEGELLSYEGINVLSGSIGYSISGIFDISFSINNRLLGERKDLVVTTISPSVTFYSIKQSEINPFSFDIGIGYEKQVYSYDYLSPLRKIKEGNFYAFDASLSKYFELTKDIRIQPTLVVSYGMGEYKYMSSYGDEERFQKFYMVYGYALPIVFYSQHNKYMNIFVITPKLLTSKENFLFGVGLTFIFSTG